MSHESGPVGEAARHETNVNVVKFLFVQPQILGVVNDELDVRRNPANSQRRTGTKNYRAT